MVSNDDVTHCPVLQIILQLITSKMVKRGKVPKTKTSLSNKVLFRTSKNLAKKGGGFFVRQRVTLVIFRALCTSLGQIGALKKTCNIPNCDVGGARGAGARRVKKTMRLV